MPCLFFLCQEHDYSQQILACVMPLTLGRANYMVKHKVAGIVITPVIAQLGNDKVSTCFNLLMQF
jgi:hypothetical protein